MKTMLRAVGVAAGIVTSCGRAWGAEGDTLTRVVPVPGVEVSTARAGDHAPIARTVVSREQIQRLNWGQDTPMALATLPGAYAYSDAGNGIGYSYLSIRGFPQRRISVLVDGVPLNDPESHEVYWIDHPDLLASTAEVQLQRGVGSALYGAASLGGSVNLETAPLSDTPRMTALTGAGSWNTRRWMFEMNSGRLAGDWNLYGRYSRIETDGYRDQSWSRLWSYDVSARRVVGNHSFRLNLFGGPEETHLAYLGIPAEYLNGEVTGDVDRDRRFNPISYPGERDHFFEPHYELIHSWAFSPSAALSQTLFWFDGRGYYDEQRFGRNLTDYRLAPWATSDSTLFDRSYYRDTDQDGVLDRDSLGRAIVERFDPVRRREVVNRHFGWIPRLRLVHPGGALTVGGELRGHDGHHTGQLLSGNGLPPGTPADLLYYDYHPRTLSGGLFLREEWDLRPSLLATADLAWRHQSYSMRDDRFDGIRFEQPYDFALPRLGLTWTPRADVRLFGSWAYARREPSFQDLYAAEAVGSLPLYRRVDPATHEFTDPLIRPERVNDLELGGSWTRERLSATLNLFRMGFRDELIPFQYNADVNNWVPTNAARSIHQGAEASGLATLPLRTGAIATLSANGTWSDNHFVEFEDALDAGFSVNRDGNRIPYFPDWTANLSARVAWRHSSFGLESQQVGRIYLDNAEDRANSIGPHAAWNAVASVSHERGGALATLSLRVLNLFDRRYATSGYMDYDAVGNLVPMFVPAATRGVLGELRVEF